MIRVVILGFFVISATASQAVSIPTCSSSQTEQTSFIQLRVKPMENMNPLVTGEEWVRVISKNPEESALKLHAFCKAHPRVPLAIAFQTLFNGD